MEKPLTPEERFALALGEHVGVTNPYCLIRRGDKLMRSPRSFNMEYNRVVNNIPGLKGYRDDAAAYAIASDALEIVQGICYRPDGPPIIDRKFNMWNDPKIEPLAERPTIFLEHIAYLIPSLTERKLLVQWLAHITQHPDQKAQYAILIVGRGGSGKSWLGKLMERIFGAANVVMIDREERIKSQFNRLFENKRLVFLHEMPTDDTAAVLDKVKGLITERELPIEPKGIDAYMAQNFANLMAISNEEVKINLTNRRWAVIRAADDPVGYDERGRTTPEHAAYYNRLWAVVPPDGTVTDELRRVLHYLRTFDLVKAKFDPLVAPLTGTKEEAAEVDDKVQARVVTAYRDRSGPFAYNLLTAEEAARYLSVPADRALTTAMIEAGCRPLRRPDGRGVQVTIDGKRPRMWAINPKVAAHHTATDTGDVAALYIAERTQRPSYARPLAPTDDWLADFE